MSAPPAITITEVRSRSEEQNRPLDFGLIRRIFRQTRPHATKRNWLFVFVLIRGVQLSCMGWAIGAVINGPIARHDVPGMLLGGIGFGVLALLTSLNLHFRSRLGLELGESVVHDLRNAIFHHLQRMPMSFFNKTKLGRILSRITSDVDTVRMGVQEVLFVGLVNAVQMIGAAIWMAWCNWRMFLVVVAMAPVLWAIHRHFRERQSQATREAQESLSRVTATLAESVGGIRVTQGFVRQDVNAGIFRRLVMDHSRYNMGISRNTAVMLPLLELNSQFFISVLLLLGGYCVLQPGIEMRMGDLIQFIFLANLFFSPIQVLGNLYHSAMMAMAGAERVFGLLDTPPEWEDAPAAIALPPIQGGVEFRHVTFGYDPKRPILRDIQFVAEPGQTIALVGHTGSGKSSIINLVAKFYLPTEGQIFIDGHEIRDIRGDSLHRQMGIVLQQNFLFTGTIMDNIRVGRPTATDEEVIGAARKLDCLDLIGVLPAGFSTLVGERGASLSLGQRQVVCFARAMLANPRILILDEATSSVDAMTEARLQRALVKLLRGRTSFVVAHRLSTIRRANVILVLDRGRIVERGTHFQLMAKSGVYAALHRQFVQADE